MCACPSHVRSSLGVIADTHLNLVKLIPADDHLHASIPLSQKLNPVLNVGITLFYRVSVHVIGANMAPSHKDQTHFFSCNVLTSIPMGKTLTSTNRALWSPVPLPRLASIWIPFGRASSARMQLTVCLK